MGVQKGVVGNKKKGWTSGTSLMRLRARGSSIDPDFAPSPIERP